MPRRFLFLISLVFLLIARVGHAPAAQPPATDEKAVADFYRGKTVRIIVGFSAGGGYDQYSRRFKKVSDTRRARMDERRRTVASTLTRGQRSATK